MPGGDRPRAGPAGSAPEGPTLVSGVELLGEYRGSGYREAPCLLRLHGRTIEMSPLLYCICTLLDGRRDLNEVAGLVSEAMERRATADDIAYLIEHKLGPLGIVAGTAGSPTGPASRPLLGLALRGPVLSKAGVRRCAGPLRRLFHTPVVVVVLAAFAALDVTLWSDHSLGGAVTGLLREPGPLVGVVALTLVAAAFHELGHAAAGVYAGAEPGVIGVGVYLIWPVFYNDIDDSYRLGRAARLRVDLGGVYFNLCFMLVEGIGYVITRSPVLLVAIAVQHLAILQQSLPFVRLDGYYLASDLAGVPDLFGRIRPILGSLLPGRPASPLVTQLKTSSRAVVTIWVLLTVPLLAALLSLFLLRLPRLSTTLWDSIGMYGRSLARAGRDGAPWSATLDALQMLLLLVPPIGICFTIAHGLRSKLTKVGEPR